MNLFFSRRCNLPMTLPCQTKSPSERLGRTLSRWRGCLVMSLMMVVWVPTHANAQQSAPLPSSSMTRIAKDSDLFMVFLDWESQTQRWLHGPMATQWMQTSLGKKLASDLTLAWNERSGSMARVRAVLENRNVTEGAMFLRDILGKEVFFVADGELSKTCRRLASIQRDAHRLSDPYLANEEKAELIYTWIDQLGPNWVFPSLMLGARFTDRERALTKVDEVEGVLRLAMGGKPELAGALALLQRVEDERGTRLRWHLKGSQIPWEFLPTNELFDEESLERLREVSEEKSLVLTFGMLDSYFVLAIGGGLDPLPEVPIDESLYRHEDVDWIHAYEDREITRVHYVSDAFADAAFELSLKHFFANLANQNLLPRVLELGDSEYRDWLLSIVDDAGWMDDQIRSHIPKQRGSTEIAWDSESGWEIHTHHRTQNRVFDGNAPLKGLVHWGEEPILALDVRLAEHPEYFATARAIVQRWKKRIDEFSELDESRNPSNGHRILFEILHLAWPTLVRAADVWQNQFLPAMNGEHLVIMQGGSLASTQWHPDMPPSDTPLPIPEIAVVTGIRSSGRWIEALKGARDVAQTWLDTLRSVQPRLLEGTTSVPTPARTDEGGVITYGYPIPDTCPAPKTMMPRVSIDQEWSIFGYSDHQLREVRSTHQPPMITVSGEERLLHVDRPLAKAAYIDVGALSKLVSPWMRYGLMTVYGDMQRPLPIPTDALPLRSPITAADLMEVWQLFEGMGRMASVTTIDPDGSTRTRAVMIRR